MNKEVIFVLINEFADWEGAFLASALKTGVDMKPTSSYRKYEVKTLSVTKEPVYSIGGFKVIPDYDLETVPTDFAALILIGGTGWTSEQAKLVLPLVSNTLKSKAIVGGICMASVFLGMNGFLNEVKHTSNTLEFLKMLSGSNYTNEANYVEAQAVSDNGIVTANGTGYLEFAKEILLLLKVDSEEKIEEYYKFNKLGFCEYLKKKA